MGVTTVLTTKWPVERILNIPRTKKWSTFEVIEMSVTSIWSLHTLYMYLNVTLYPKICAIIICQLKIKIHLNRKRWEGISSLGTQPLLCLLLRGLLFPCSSPAGIPGRTEALSMCPKSHHVPMEGWYSCQTQGSQSSSLWCPSLWTPLADSTSIMSVMKEEIEKVLVGPG